jgi:hypothetical protein
MMAQKSYNFLSYRWIMLKFLQEFLQTVFSQIFRFKKYRPKA